MAWNGSNLGKNEAKQPAKVNSSRRMHLPVVTILLGLVGVAVIYFLFPQSEGLFEKSDSKQKGLIAENKAEIKDYRADTAESIGKHSNHGGANGGEVSSAVAALTAQPKVIKKVYTNSVSAVRSRIEFFKHRSESELAFLTCVPLGTPIIGSRDFDDDFVADLKASLKEEIVIEPDDPDDIAYYKDAVIQVKKELKELLDRGEDVVEVLNETRRELQKMGVYKQQIELMVQKAERENDLTDDDMQDLISAANAMLEDKGVEPFEFNPITRAIIKRKPFPKPEDIELENSDDTVEEYEGE